LDQSRVGFQDDDKDGEDLIVFGFASVVIFIYLSKTKRLIDRHFVFVQIRIHQRERFKRARSLLMKIREREREQGLKRRRLSQIALRTNLSLLKNDVILDFNIKGTILYFLI
jgi:hypothetical protein